MMLATLGSFFSAWLIEHLAHLHTDLVVSAVVLGLTLGRVHRAPGASSGLLALAVVPVATAGASVVGTLMGRHVVVGDSLFALALTAAIWVRRFGPVYTRAGTLATVPFIAQLVTPAPPVLRPSHVMWSAAVAVVAVVWVLLAQLVGRALRLLPRPAPPAAAPSPKSSAVARQNARPRVSRISVSDRMALQMGLGLGLAFVLGHLIFGVHWPWMVLTAYIVASGNRGRGDVVYKGGLRIAGAVVGTVAATLMANTFSAGDKWAVVAIFAALAVATWLRDLNYAYWAGGVTAALAFLYGYFGETGSGLLHTRLEGILGGAAVAIAAAWVVLPIKTSSVLRRRMADALGELSDHGGAQSPSEHRGTYPADAGR